MFFFFFKQKTAYEMRISDWSSDVCSSDLALPQRQRPRLLGQTGLCSAALLLDLPQDERRGDGRGRRQLRAGRLRGTSSQHRHPRPLREPAAAVAAQLHPGRARRALIPSEPERGEPSMQIDPYLFFDGRAEELGDASCRERACRYVQIEV